MKKGLAIVLGLLLVTTMLFGCGGDQEEPAPEPQDEVTVSAVKTGVGVVSSIAKSKDATAEAAGLAQADSVIVAVTVGEDGKIIKCKIDSAQTKVEISTDGKFVTPLDTIFASKQDLGADYGMAAASSLGKEWNEEADALADYFVGKTVDEIKGIAVTEEGVPTDAELASSVTIKINDYVSALEKAVANAIELGASADDVLGLYVETNISHSAEPGEEDGNAQAYSNYMAVTFDADGVITSTYIEASQSNIGFNKEGKITTDLATAELATKRELGDAYGMKAASGIGKEWYEQADAFQAYVQGKTVDEVKGIAIDEEGSATDAELSSSVTIGVDGFISYIEKAYAKAS